MDTLLEKLQQQLAQYGLDPSDWSVEPLSHLAESRFHVRSVQTEAEVQMLGHACLENGEWLDLCLVNS